MPISFVYLGLGFIDRKFGSIKSETKLKPIPIGEFTAKYVQHRHQGVFQSRKNGFLKHTIYSVVTHDRVVALLRN
jgi:hypothetical protein